MLFIYSAYDSSLLTVHMQHGPYLPSRGQRATIAMFGMRPSLIAKSYPSKEDFDLLWNRYSSEYNRFRGAHQGLAPPSGQHPKRVHQTNSTPKCVNLADVAKLDF